MDQFLFHYFCLLFYFLGGKELQVAFDNYTKKTVHSPGTAFRLTNGKLPCGRVIYAVVPSADTGNKNYRKNLLGKSLSSSLKIADDEKCETVSVPLIGANYGHFSAMETAQVLVDSVLEYFQENPSTSIKKLDFLDANSISCSKLREALVYRVGLKNIQEEFLDEGDGGGGGDAANKGQDDESVTGNAPILLSVQLRD